MRCSDIRNNCCTQLSLMCHAPFIAEVNNKNRTILVVNNQNWSPIIQIQIVLLFMFYRSLFVLLYFLFWPLCCLFFFDSRIVITPLVSSNSSYTGTRGQDPQCPSYLITIKYSDLDVYSKHMY